MNVRERRRFRAVLACRNFSFLKPKSTITPSSSFAWGNEGPIGHPEAVGADRHSGGTQKAYKTHFFIFQLFSSSSADGRRRSGRVHTASLRTGKEVHPYDCHKLSIKELTANRLAVTHGLTQARFGRYGDDYEPPADAVRMCESDFEGISPDAGPLEALIRLELTEFLLTKTIAEGDTERSTALQLKLLNLCDCLLDYFNDERGRTVPPEKNVLLLKGLGLNPNFGHYEVAQLFEGNTQ